MRFKVDATSISWVDSDLALADAASRWGDVVGIDSEFQRTDTFYPLPGLYQICSDGHVFLIDPLSIENWTPLCELLQDPSRVKVMHACSEDLELFDSHLGVSALNVFDTQLAQAFVSDDFSIGYARLVESRLGIALDKDQTRSDWRARPLTPQQIQYAAADVWHLPTLHAQINERLQTLERRHWFDEDMANAQVYAAVDASAYYRNVKGAGRLSASALHRLQGLCAWREVRAREQNVPRSRVVRDEHLLSFAERSSLGRSDLERTLPRGVVRRFADDLIAAHRIDAGTPAPAPLPDGLTPAQNRLVRDLRDHGRQRADQLGLAAELLSRRRDVEALVRQFVADGTLSSGFRGWREEVVGANFLSRLQGLQTGASV